MKTKEHSRWSGRTFWRIKSRVRFKNNKAEYGERAADLLRHEPPPKRIGIIRVLARREVVTQVVLQKSTANL